MLPRYTAFLCALQSPCQEGLLGCEGNCCQKYTKEKWCPRAEGPEGLASRREAKEHPKWCYLLCDSFVFEGNLSLVKLWVIHGLAEWNECLVSSCSPDILCSNQFLPKSHSHLFCLYIHCCIFGSPRSGVERYNLSYLQCCHWECQGILLCSTCLNFRGNKYKIPLGTIKTSGSNNAELVLSLNNSSCVCIAPQSFSEVACLIFLSILLHKGRNKSMIVFLCVLVALLHPRKR